MTDNDIFNTVIQAEAQDPEFAQAYRDECARIERINRLSALVQFTGFSRPTA